MSAPSKPTRPVLLACAGVLAMATALIVTLGGVGRTKATATGKVRPAAGDPSPLAGTPAT